MNLGKLGIFIFALFLFLPISGVTAQSTNAGFIPGNIWYSKDPFAEGDVIKIYTLIFNPDSRKFSGTVSFFDSSTLLGKKDFSVPGTSTKDVSISWTATTGNHEIYGQISNAKFLNISGAYVTASISDNKTIVSLRSVQSKVVAQNVSDGVNAVNNTFNNAIDSVQNIGSNAKKIIPTSIIQTVGEAISTLDGTRINIETSIENAKAQTQVNLNALIEGKKSAKTVSQLSSVTQKPFAYISLFVFTILSYIFKYQVLFYCILFVIISIVIKFFWEFFFE